MRVEGAEHGAAFKQDGGKAEEETEGLMQDEKKKEGGDGGRGRRGGSEGGEGGGEAVALVCCYHYPSQQPEGLTPPGTVGREAAELDHFLCLANIGQVSDNVHFAR